MRIPLYHLDAFSAKAFGGNPAAVCPLPSWIDDRLMQSIAAENNLAETAFFVPASNEYHIRWFTPTDERRSRQLRSSSSISIGIAKRSRSTRRAGRCASIAAPILWS